jgi:hypothetical protein
VLVVAEKPFVREYRFTAHAHLEMIRRQITETEVAQVLSAPEQTREVRPGRLVFQSRIERGDPPRMYLMRVFVDIDRRPAEVVTAYRTSKIEKYWRRDYESDL